MLQEGGWLQYSPTALTRLPAWARADQHLPLTFVLRVCVCAAHVSCALLGRHLLGVQGPPAPVPPWYRSSTAALGWHAGPPRCHLLVAHACVARAYIPCTLICPSGRLPACSNLSNYALSGTLPASLDLSELEVLDLSSNQLHNSLPANLTLPKLQVRAAAADAPLGGGAVAPPGWGGRRAGWGAGPPCAMAYPHGRRWSRRYSAALAICSWLECFCCRFCRCCPTTSEWPDCAPAATVRSMRSMWPAPPVSAGVFAPPGPAACPAVQRFNLGDNKLMGPLPASWAANFPELGELTLRGNDLAGTLPPAWVADSGFATPFRMVLQPGNPLLCGGVASGANHTLWYSDAAGGLEHEIVTTLGSCAQGDCGIATVNASAPNLFDLAWSNGVSTLDLESWNELVQANGAPKLGTPITLPCYPSNAPTFFGANAAHRMATWQSSTEGARVSSLPVSGERTTSSAQDCSATADAPAFWMVDIQRPTKVQVGHRAGSLGGAARSRLPALGSRPGTRACRVALPWHQLSHFWFGGVLCRLGCGGRGGSRPTQSCYYCRCYWCSTCLCLCAGLPACLPACPRPHLQAVLIRSGPEQMQGVIIRVSETPDPTAGIVCKSNLTFDPSLGEIIVCERPNKVSTHLSILLC